MTYNQIISQILRRLGVSGSSNELKADLRVAISWAEQELVTAAKPNVLTHIIDINASTFTYPLPDDMESHKQIIVYDSSENELVHVEVTYEEWLKWSPGATNGSENDVVGSDIATTAVVEYAMYQNKAVVCINNYDGVKVLHIKPQFAGKVLIMYSPKRSDDIFDDLEAEPCIQEEYQHYIIPGALYYLAQIKAGECRSKGDDNGVQFYNRLEANSYAQFEKRKQKLIENSNTISEPVAAKPFTWYENPRKYVRNYR